MAQQKQKRSLRLIGVLHLPPLPGAPGAGAQPAWRRLDQAGHVAVREAQILEKAGFDALILENFGDAPFYADQVPPETVASLSVLCAALRESTALPLGLNVLRNDASAALAIASVCGLDFIRVNVLSGVAAADQGLLIGKAATLLRERGRLNSSVAIWADVHVKHALSLSSNHLESAILDTIARSGADAVIVSGVRTGVAPEIETARAAAHAAHRAGAPCYVGSGVQAALAQEWLGAVDGVIVSSDLRQKGRPGAPLDLSRVKRFVTLATASRARKSIGAQRKKKKSG